jgi:hypothetical protein
MNMHQQMGELRRQRDRQEFRLKNSETLSKEYFMSREVFEALVLMGQNPKNHLGAKSVSIGKTIYQ